MEKEVADTFAKQISKMVKKNDYYKERPDEIAWKYAGLTGQHFNRLIRVQRHMISERMQELKSEGYDWLALSALQEAVVKDEA